MKQRGFIPLPLMAWGAIGAGVIILGLGIALKVQTARLDHCKAEYAAFVAETKRLGEEAQRKAKETEAKNLKAKEIADADTTKLRTDNAALARRLRQSTRAGGGSLSPAPAGSKCPQGQTCFDTAEYQRADGIFVTGARKLADEGTAVSIDLNTARKWADTVRP